MRDGIGVEDNKNASHQPMGIVTKQDKIIGSQLLNCCMGVERYDFEGFDIRVAFLMRFIGVSAG